MPSDFILIPSGQIPPPEDHTPAMLAHKWFASISDIPSDTATRLRKLVQQKLEQHTCQHLLPKMPGEYLAGIELQLCVEQVITEQWDLLTPDERLLARFPTVQAVGEQVPIPNRGMGTVVIRELTRRFGIYMVFRMQDGSFFEREFID